MRVSYDPEVDGVLIRFDDQGTYDGSEEILPDVVLDFDEDDRVIGVNVLGARKVFPAEDLEVIRAADASGAGTAEYDRALDIGRSLAGRLQESESGVGV